MKSQSPIPHSSVWMHLLANGKRKVKLKLPGGYFLIHRVDVRMGDEQIDSIEIIGYDSSTGKYPMHYFGYKGSTGIMHASVDGNTWTFTGETERFTGSFNEAGDIITGKWERLDSDEWVGWMDIKLTKNI